MCTFVGKVILESKGFLEGSHNPNTPQTASSPLWCLRTYSSPPHSELSLSLSSEKVLVTQSCPSLCYPMHCSPPGSSVHGISQARILEWVAISFSRGSSQLRDQTWVSCLGGGFFTTEPPGKPACHRINPKDLKLRLRKRHSPKYTQLIKHHVFSVLLFVA